MRLLLCDPYNGRKNISESVQRYDAGGRADTIAAAKLLRERQQTARDLGATNRVVSLWLIRSAWESGIIRAVGLHLVLNGVDPGHYMGWTGALAACENDAQDMAAIAQVNSFDVTLLLTREATSICLLQLLAQVSQGCCR